VNTTATMGPTQPENGRTTEGHQSCQPVSSARLLAHFSSVNQRRRDPDLLSPADVAFARECFDPACDVFCAERQIKAEELADLMGVDRHYLSKMRNGKKPIAGRHVLTLSSCAPALAKLEEPLNEEAGLEPPREKQLVVLTEEDFRAAALEIQTESETGRFALAHKVAARKGVRPEYAMQLLKK
jgi:transcriptional regulator with XRE-family HTH domain